MARRRRREQIFYDYECSLTGEAFRRTAKIEKTDDLVSVGAWYELHPEKDDRPAHVKKELGILED